jgi:very-short-patch-repair endonuclease
MFAMAEPFNRARKLRKDSTYPERKLWHALRDRRLCGLKFRRQHAIGPYYADFYCHAAKLIVEVDGDSHDDTRFEYDMQRQRYFQDLGYRVFRVTNDDVLDDMEPVALGIARAAGIDISRFQ